MSKRLSVDEKLSAIRRLRDQQPAEPIIAELRAALSDKSNLVVAAAAAVAGDWKLTALGPDLEAGFGRFLVNPQKTDKLCRAKIAIVTALEKIEEERPDVFASAARHVQLEPVWGGHEDTAAPLRAAALLALARIDYDGLLPLLVDSLTDPEKEVRIAAAQVLGQHGTEAAGLLLRFKALLGDREPDVVSECLCGLLCGAPVENMTFIRRFLDSDDVLLREAAILALGRSRLPAAFPELQRCWREKPGTLTETIFLAMATLRLPAATDFLLETIATGAESEATPALRVLSIYRHDPRLREQIAAAASQSGHSAVRAQLKDPV
jgi:HEAT repeat protein